MNAGIAISFNKYYGLRNILKRKYGNRSQSFTCGYCLRENVMSSLPGDKTAVVYNLVTKRLCTLKPSYESLAESLREMKQQMLLHEEYKIAMPLIGQGFDNLSWSRVKEVLSNVFYDTDIEILVCYFSKDKELIKDDI